jgi:hypothetical protein
MTLIHCLLSGIVIIRGIFTHNEYRFSDENNHILEVNNNDVPDLLSKIDVQGGCCNASRKEIPMFEISK